MTDLHYLELNEVSSLIQSGEVSARDVTTHMLDRIASVDKTLNSYIEVTSDIALVQADAVDEAMASGGKTGGLQGVPVALKDLCDMEGIATTAAMKIHRNTIATQDATVTRRLKESGAVILGKLNMTEGAYAEHLPPYGPPINPWRPEIWAGASSSGSGVAAAAGLSFGTVASDTGASIRLPTAANAATGLKPTWGRVSRYGIFELAATLDHIGPICRSALDCGMMLDVMAGHDVLDPTSSLVPTEPYSYVDGTDLSSLTIGIDRAWASENVEKATAQGVLQALDVLEGLGARVVEVLFPDPEQIVWDWFAICGPQTALAHRDTYPSRKDEYGSVLAGQIDQGLEMSALEHHETQMRREAFTGRVQHLFKGIDLLICPAVGCKVPTLEEIAAIDNDMIYDLHRFTCSFTMARNPTITFPTGFDADGFPTAAQLVGPYFSERQLVRAAHAYQSQTDMHKVHPAI